MQVQRAPGQPGQAGGGLQRPVPQHGPLAQQAGGVQLADARQGDPDHRLPGRAVHRPVSAASVGGPWWSWWESPSPVVHSYFSLSHFSLVCLSLSICLSLSMSVTLYLSVCLSQCLSLSIRLSLSKYFTLTACLSHSHCLSLPAPLYLLTTLGLALDKIIHLMKSILNRCCPYECFL